VLAGCVHAGCSRRGPPGAPPAGGHAAPHLCTRPPRGAGAPAGAPRSTAESGPERPGQAAPDGGGEGRWGCYRAKTSGQVVVAGWGGAHIWEDGPSGMPLGRLRAAVRSPPWRVCWVAVSLVCVLGAEVTPRASCSAPGGSTPAACRRGPHRRQKCVRNSSSQGLRTLAHEVGNTLRNHNGRGVGIGPNHIGHH
jgi:hypothetical protein